MHKEGKDETQSSISGNRLDSGSVASSSKLLGAVIRSSIVTAAIAALMYHGKIGEWAGIGALLCLAFPRLINSVAELVKK